MELIYFTSAVELNGFIQEASPTGTVQAGAEFLQSWPWGEILRHGGAEIIRVGVREQEKILAAATLVKKILPLGQFYWLSPRGPVYGSVTEEEQVRLLQFLASAIRQLDRRAIFWRIEPEALPAAPRLAASQLQVKKTVNLEPAQTLLLDLALSPDQLLAELQQKTRYNIRLAAKKGVKIRAGSPADWPEFWRLMRLTGERDNFRLHEARHYQNLTNFDQGFIKLFLAEYQGRNIAAGLFCFWGDKVTYLHGASDNQARSVMAPYLLQWSVIQEAQAAGYSYYDFYGIDEQKWPGVTRFKTGFGGRIVGYAGTWDIIWQPVFYGLYGLVRKLKRMV
jgi:lipid II:glycine glycyltransferase (peptidoglycan interpeptide bridge formation enzyme)